MDMENTKNSFTIWLNTLLVIVSLIMAKQSFAGVEVYTSQIKGSEIFSGRTMDIYDHKYSQMETSVAWKNQFTNVKTSNRLILSFDEGSTKKIPANFTAKVVAELTYYSYNNSSNVFTSHVMQQTLEINYDETKNFQHKSLIQFEGGHGLSVKIISVTTNQSNYVAPLKLEGQVEVLRYYRFDVTKAVSNLKKIDLDNGSTIETNRGELEVYWDFMPGAEEYELEWTHISDYKGDNLDSKLTESEIPLDLNLFKNNSTRITITTNSFKIPLIYERGFIIYRVRGVGRTGQDFKSRVYSYWTFEQSSNCVKLSCVPPDYKFPCKGHQGNLNWQASVSFAEDGKNKVGVTYFDGSLRSRQVVTKSNTEDQTIVGETLYDHQGRATIQILPVPTWKKDQSIPDRKIEYKGELHKNASGSVYSNETDFDIDGPEGCKPFVGPMQPTTGASLYYSTANPDKEGHQALVPDAGGYPFTQVQYTPDNTGRISRQGGVGLEHQLGTNRETKYLYAKPEQEELDRLFGSEVGDASHYKKNAVIDANGQVSVSYLDPQGKVVATGLAGETPVGLEQVGPNDRTMKVDLLGKQVLTDKSGSDNTLDYSTGTRTLNREMIVTTKGVRKFDYEMKGEKLETSYIDALGVVHKICADCVFDLTVRLMDECGNDYLPGLNGDDFLTKKIGDTLTGMQCNTASPSYKTASEITNWETKQNGNTKELEVGTYTLTKNLKLNQAALNFYTQQYISKIKSDAKPSYNDLFDEEKAKINFIGCEWTCDTCKYIANQESDAVLREAKLKACQELCDSENDLGFTCESKIIMLMGDMSPSGQYGGVNKDGDTGEPFPKIDNDNDKTVVKDEKKEQKLVFDPSVHTLSIFNSQNKLPAKVSYQANEISPSWKYPYNPNATLDKQKQYLDANGQIAKIMIKKISDGVYLPAIDVLSSTDASQLVSMDQNGVYYSIPAKYLLNIEDFIGVWQDAWAKSLIYYHPEYTYYTYCLDILDATKSNEFDEIIMISETKEEAINNFAKYGYTGVDVMNLLPSDPFFNAPASKIPKSSTYKIFMNKFVTNYAGSKSMAEIAYITSHCPEYNPNLTSQICATTAACLPMPTNHVITNEEWGTYKGLYLSMKQKFVKQDETKYAIDHTGYNGCIGSSPFNPFDHGFFTSTYTVPVNYTTFWGWLINKATFHTIYTHRSQFTNPEQTCNNEHFVLYKDKTARFPLPTTLLKNTGLDINKCYPTSQYDAESEVSFVNSDPKDFIGMAETPSNCVEENQAINDKMLNVAEQKFFTECGQCPLAFQLQSILNAVAGRDKLTATNLSLTCGPNGTPYPELGPRMLQQLAGSGNVVWNVDNIIPNDRLVIKFERGGFNTKVTLKMSTGSLFNFDQITSICCLRATNALSYLAPEASGHNFTLKATIGAGVTKKEVLLEGSSDLLNIQDCNFPLTCTPSIAAKQAQNLFNSLLYSSKGDNPPVTSITSKFLSTNEVSLASPVASASSTTSTYSTAEVSVNGLFITGELKQQLSAILGTDYQDWVWKSSGTGNSITATIYDHSVGDGTSCTFTFTSTENGFDFSNVFAFSNIEPDNSQSLNTDGVTSNHFIITALVKDNNSKSLSYKTVTGTSLFITPIPTSTPKGVIMGACIVPSTYVSNSGN
jgi:hypothetical protein